MQPTQFHNARVLISACLNKHVFLGVDKKGQLFKAGLWGRIWILIKDIFSKGAETKNLEKTIRGTLICMKRHVDVIQEALHNEVIHLPRDNNILYHVWTHIGASAWNQIHKEQPPLHPKLNPFSFSMNHMKAIEHSKELIKCLIIKPENEKELSFGTPCIRTARGVHHIKHWDSNNQLRRFKDNQKLKELVEEICAFTQFSFIPEGPSKDFLSIFYRKSFREHTRLDLEKLESIDFLKGKMNCNDLCDSYFD